MIKVQYKHEAEPDRNELLEFDSIAALVKHIQQETFEFLGEDDIEPESMVVLNDGQTYYEEDFGKYHSWTIQWDNEWEKHTKEDQSLAIKVMYKTGIPYSHYLNNDKFRELNPDTKLNEVALNILFNTVLKGNDAE